MSDLIYIASPYSHPDSDVRRDRFEEAARVCDYLLTLDYHVYSPICQWHPILEVVKNTHFCSPTQVQKYNKLLITDFVFLRRCDKLLVVTLDGWKESNGIKQEVELARSYKIPIRYYSTLDILQVTDKLALNFK